MHNKSLLFYNLFPKNRWKGITKTLLKKVPHDDIIIHVALPYLAIPRIYDIKNELKKYPKIKKIIFSINKKKLGETIGFVKLQKNIDLDSYDSLTYIHSKGSSRKRKDTQAVRDWTELMRYFVVEHLEQSENAFKKGFFLSGVNLSQRMHPTQKDKLNHPLTKFIYEGNFVSINLNALRDTFKTTQCVKDYYGVERFWGMLCPQEKAYSMYNSNIKNHYEELYPKELYQNLKN